MNGLTIKDILMSEMRDIKFTHDQIIEVGGEYYKNKETGEWVCKSTITDYDKEWINIEIEQFYERQADKYY